MRQRRAVGRGDADIVGAQAKLVRSGIDPEPHPRQPHADPDPGAVERGFDIRSEKIQVDRTLHQPPRRDQHNQGQRGNDRPAPAQQAVRAARRGAGLLRDNAGAAAGAGRRRPLGGDRRRSAARSCREPERVLPRSAVRSDSCGDAVILCLRRDGRQSGHSAGSRRPPAARTGPVRVERRARRGGGRKSRRSRPASPGPAPGAARRKAKGCWRRCSATVPFSAGSRSPNGIS